MIVESKVKNKIAIKMCKTEQRKLKKEKLKILLVQNSDNKDEYIFDINFMY